MSIREQFEKYKCEKCVAHPFQGKALESCKNFNKDYIEYLEQLNEAKDKVIEMLLKRLKKYHNENKEPEVTELMDIIEAENILEASHD